MRWFLRGAPLFWVLLLALGCVHAADAATMSLPGVRVSVADASGSRQQMSTAIQVLLALTALSLAPAILVSMTAFVRIVIVLSMLRHALGIQETPPNTVLVSLALFLTLFTMQPVLSQIDSNAFQPYLKGSIGFERATEIAIQPVREFMIRQTREQDLMLMLDVSKTER